MDRKKLKKELKRLNISTAQLAKELGLARVTIYKILQGTRNPSPPVEQAIWHTIKQIEIRKTNHLSNLEKLQLLLNFQGKMLKLKSNKNGHTIIILPIREPGKFIKTNNPDSLINNLLNSEIKKLTDLSSKILQ